MQDDTPTETDAQETEQEQAENYDQKRQELIEDAAETKEKMDAEQSEMLAAVASGDDGIDVEKYETVQIGDVEARVKAWLPGDTMDVIERAHRLAQKENPDDALESIRTMVNGMEAVTESLEHTETGTRFDEGEDIREFWNGMYKKWGVDGFQQAAQTVLEPAADDMEAKSEAVDGFRRNGERSKPSDYR